MSTTITAASTKGTGRFKRLGYENTNLKIICNYIDNTLSIFSDCFNYNVDSAGHDLETKVGISSIHACQELCKSNSDCNYFLFGYTAAEGTCWLKTEKVATFTSYEGLVFGPKTCGMNIFFCKYRLIMFYI